MKTKLCKPVLVESKDNENRNYPCILKHSYMFGDKGIIGYYNSNIRTPTIAMKLILISLDSDDRIEVGDNVYLDLQEHSRITKVINLNSGHSIFNVDIEEGYARLESLKKVIATQSQLSPEYINQFIEEYNKDEVKDVEIEMEWNKPFMSVNEDNERVENYPIQPKLTNGFITIVTNSDKILNTIDDGSDSIDKIEEAAEACYVSGKVPVGEHPTITTLAFIAGAKSPEAKEYWQQGMYTKQQHLEAIEAGINEGLRSAQKSMYTKEEVERLCREALYYSYNNLPGELTPTEGMNKWINQNIKKLG